MVSGRRHVGVLLTMALMLAATVLAPAAHAAFPGPNGKFVVYSPATSTYDVLNADGSGRTSLTTASDGGGNIPAAVWSPDGTKLAFTDLINGSAAPDELQVAVFTINADGSGRTRVSTPRPRDAGGTGPGYDLYPDWSPDGSELVVDSVFGPFFALDGKGSVDVFNADGSGRRTLTTLWPSMFSSAVWSPDGTKLAFDDHITEGNQSDARIAIFTIGAGGGGRTQVSTPVPIDAGQYTRGSDTYPDWSPDGSKLVVRSEATKTYDVLNADGSGRAILTGGPDNLPGAVWSPDGTKLAFPVFSNGSDAGVYTINADGSGRTQLTGGHDSAPHWGSVLDAAGVAITGPSGTVSNNDPLFEFVAVGTAATGSFQCKLDSGAFEACASPRSYSNLPDGEHTFAAKFIADGETDGPQASRTWTIDTTAPSAVIDTAPPAQTTARSASFTFHSTEPDSTFLCSIDFGPEEDCSSPKTYTGLALGPHRLAIRATDVFGHAQQSPTRHLWEITAPAGPGPGGVGGGAPGVDPTSPPGPTGAPGPGCPAGTDATRVSFGVIVALGCFKNRTRNGQEESFSTAKVRVNGFTIIPRGGEVIVDGDLVGGTVRATSTVDIGIGDYSVRHSAFHFDGLAQAGVSALNRALSIGEEAQEMAGFKLTGSLNFEFSSDNDGQTKITAKVSLPHLFSALPRSPANSDPVGVSLEVPATVSNAKGVSLGFRAKASNIWLFGRVLLKEIDLSYDHDANVWAGSAKMAFPDKPGGAASALSFAVGVEAGPDGIVGPLRKFSLQASGFDKPIGPGLFLKGFGADLARAGDRATFSANGTVSAGPKLSFKPIFDGSVASLKGTATLGFPVSFSGNAADYYFELAGTGSVLEIPLADVKFKLVPPDFAGDRYVPGSLSLAGKTDLTFGGYGWYSELTDATLSPTVLNIEARGQVKLPGGIFQSSEGVISDNGFAVCFNIYGHRVGFGKLWFQQSLHALGSNLSSPVCDLAPYRNAKASTSQAGARTITLPKGAGLAAFTVAGAGDPAKFTLTGPRFLRIETPAGPESVNTPSYMLIQDPDANVTHVIVPKPKAGAYTFTPTAGPIRSVTVARDAAQPKVAARVSGAGERRTLSWRASGLEGRRLAFVDRGRSGAARALISTSKPRGKLGFSADSPGGQAHRIVATIESRAGIPDSSSTVARYQAPALRAPGRVKSVRRKGQTISWRGPAGAATYAISVRSKGATILNKTLSKHSVRLPRRLRRSKVQVIIVALGVTGLPGQRVTVELAGSK